MIHYQLIGAVRDPYIEKNKVELKKERLEELKREIILNCSEKNIINIKLQLYIESVMMKEQ